MKKEKTNTDREQEANTQRNDEERRRGKERTYERQVTVTQYLPKIVSTIGLNSNIHHECTIFPKT
jgi:hypothetical protein